MEYKEKQSKEEPKNPKLQVQIKPGGENLSEAELDKVAGGSIHLNTSRSNVYVDAASPKLSEAK